MKNLLSLLIFNLLLTSFCLSQAYKPFLRDSAHWTIQENLCALGPCDPGDIYNPANYLYTSTIHLKIDGDTIVNGNTYKKLIQNLYRSGREGPYHVGYFPCNTLGILWEDTSARKVYINKVNHPYAFYWCMQDTVLFDFSKQVGDSMSWSVTCADSIFIVDSINYTSIYNSPIKTWYLHDDHYAPFQMYESIGSSLGFWGNQPSFEGPYSSELTNYCIGSDSLCGFSCDTHVGVIDQSEKQYYLAVYPNPAIDHIIINIRGSTGYDDLKFTITNILGQALDTELITQTHTEVNISALPSGIYLWQFTSDRNIIRSGKIVHD